MLLEFVCSSNFEKYSILIYRYLLIEKIPLCDRFVAHNSIECTQCSFILRLNGRQFYHLNNGNVFVCLKKKDYYFKSNSVNHLLTHLMQNIFHSYLKLIGFWNNFQCGHLTSVRAKLLEMLSKSMVSKRFKQVFPRIIFDDLLSISIVVWNLSWRRVNFYVKYSKRIGIPFECSQSIDG